MLPRKWVELAQNWRPVPPSFNLKPPLSVRHDCEL